MPLDSKPFLPVLQINLTYSYMRDAALPIYLSLHGQSFFSSS